MTFYKGMQEIASGLLQEFDQGGLALAVHTAGTGPAHNPGPAIYVETPFAGAAKGVTGDHLKDTLIQSSDLSVTMPGNLSPKMADKVVVNGHQHSIVKIIPKPAAGTPVAYEVVVRR